MATSQSSVFDGVSARIGRAALLVVLSLLPFLGAQAAERRVALVVGVGAYKNVPTLPNPPNDARDVAAALTRLGFETETLVDPDRLAFEAAARRLGERAKNADAALFFFAGHALEAAGRNWLVPAPADIHTDRDLRFEALDLDGVLEQLDGAARLSILILDACRDNPFRRRLQAGSRGIGASGLGQVQAAAGTLVAFATAPGTVAGDGNGRNSPFSGALLRHIETPGLELRQLMAVVRKEVREATRNAQVPWENSALEGEFFFRPAPAPPTTPAAVAPAAAAQAAAAQAAAAQAAAPGAVELAFWDSVRDSRDPADFRAYLARFPTGAFADLARNRLTPAARKTSSSATIIPVPAVPGDPATSEGREILLHRLLGSVHPVSSGQLLAAVQQLRLHAGGPRHRALAVAPEAQYTMRGNDFHTADEAERVVLERCQIRNNEPCVLFALDDTVRPPTAGKDWPRRDMERVHYAGPYRADRVPAVSDARRAEPDIAGYGAARDIRAMAIHPLGRVFVVRTAVSQTAAEAEALRQCELDPVRAGSSGPCFLYASGNRVVLADRRVQIPSAEPAKPPPVAASEPPPVPAVTAAGSEKPSSSPGPSAGPAPAGIGPPPPVPAARAAGSDKPPSSPGPSAGPAPAGTGPPPPETSADAARAALLRRMIEAMPFAPRATAESMLGLYLAEPTHRAIAVEPGQGQTWRGTALRSAEEAEQLVLERCQVRYRTACVLFAVDDDIRAPVPGATWQPRDMPRVRDAKGAFDAERMPLLADVRRRTPGVAGYAGAAGPKAIAVHPTGRVFVVTAAESQEKADADALSACDSDPGRGGRDGPCFVYASGDQVVLNEHRTAIAAESRRVAPAKPLAPR